MELIKIYGGRKLIREVIDANEKVLISRTILEALSDWFGIDEAREEYISNSAAQIFFADIENSRAIGFLCLKETGKDTVELAVMGVLQEFHRRGIGKSLFESAKKFVREKGYSFIQVKTVAMGYYENYDNTNRFYQSIGFKEFEIIPALWGKDNPCQIYIMSVK